MGLGPDKDHWASQELLMSCFWPVLVCEKASGPSCQRKLGFKATVFLNQLSTIVNSLDQSRWRHTHSKVPKPFEDNTSRLIADWPGRLKVVLPKLNQMLPNLSHKRQSDIVSTCFIECAFVCSFQYLTQLQTSSKSLLVCSPLDYERLRQAKSWILSPL